MNPKHFALYGTIVEPYEAIQAHIYFQKNLHKYASLKKTKQMKQHALAYYIAQPHLNQSQESLSTNICFDKKKTNST